MLKLKTFHSRIIFRSVTTSTCPIPRAVSPRRGFARPRYLSKIHTVNCLRVGNDGWAVENICGGRVVMVLVVRGCVKGCRNTRDHERVCEPFEETFADRIGNECI